MYDLVTIALGYLFEARLALQRYAERSSHEVNPQQNSAFERFAAELPQNMVKVFER